MAVCPVCKMAGVGVDKSTVANHAKESCWPLGDSKYSMCENPECDVVYFTTSKGRTLKKSDVKTRVTFKERILPGPCATVSR
jgi:hypothetical protein